MGVQRLGCQDQRSLGVAAIERFPGCPPQLPGLHGYGHERCEVGSAAGADPRATEACLADRTLEPDGQSVLPLDEEQQLFE